MTGNIYKKIKTVPIDIWFFIGFLLTFTLSVRKVLYYFPIQGAFNEYTGLYLYASDIFLFLAVASWLLIILRYKSKYLSRINLRLSSAKLNPVLILPAFLVALSFLSIWWSQNKVIATYQSIKLFEVYLLYLFIALRLIPFVLTKRSKLFHVEQFGFLIIGIGLIQSIIGIIQVALQHSIGLVWLKESIVSPTIPGVAKIILNGHRLIRAYGLMPHPNILGGFLATCIVLLLYYKNSYSKSSENNPAASENSGPIVPRGTMATSDAARQNPSHALYILFKNTKLQNKWLIYAILLVLSFGLLLTISKSAILGLLIALSYIYVPRGTFGLSGVHKRRTNSIFSLFNKLFHVEQFRIYLLLGCIILVSGLLVLKPNYHAIFIQSLEERMLYLNISFDVIRSNLISGVGISQFVWRMQDYSNITLQPWEYQPVHNVFLLIWSELGIIGLGLFTWLIGKLFSSDRPKAEVSSNMPRTENQSSSSNHGFHNLSITPLQAYLRAILLSLVFIMLFDHYLWDIQQGSLMLWMIMGLIAGIKMNDSI